VKSLVFYYRITTQLWQGSAIIILTPIRVLNDSANVRTILCSSSAASCKSLLVGQELHMCLFHYLYICSLECDSFETPSILSIAVHNSLLSCFLHSQMATMFSVITVILLASNVSVLHLFWNSLKLLYAFSCIFQVSSDLVPYEVIFRLKKKKSLWAKPGKEGRQGTAETLCLNKNPLTCKPSY
jgi:hypothetical protein